MSSQPVRKTQTFAVSRHASGNFIVSSGASVPFRAFPTYNAAGRLAGSVNRVLKELPGLPVARVGQLFADHSPLLKAKGAKAPTPRKPRGETPISEDKA